MKPLSIYIHWPFCVSKCPYCDFNSRPLASDLDEAAWQAAYERELSFYAEGVGGREIATIYFGGGTPSLMRPATIAALLNKIAALWTVQQNCEITLEANPSSSEAQKFRAFRDAGVNRLSLGVQALSDQDLRFLGRAHDENAAREAIENAQKVFDRFSFDLIYARAQQTLQQWAAELRDALQYNAQHMSLYQLTIEEGTPFFKRAQKQEMLQAPAAEAALMYEMTQDIMAQAGLPAYEVSNHAAPGQESRHNLTYWEYNDFIGIGPGAHGRFVQGGERLMTATHAAPQTWLAQVQREGHGCAERAPVSAREAQEEALMMGLRCIKGIEYAAWRDKFGSPLMEFIAPEKVAALIAEGFLRDDGRHLAPTRAGLQRLDAVLRHLV